MKKGLVFFLFCLICGEVFAGVFSVIPTDKSQEYLGMVFGGSVGAINLGGGNNPTLSLMFERFNFIIVTIGAVVLSYIGVMTTINTAREGEAMGKKMSLWVPLRAFSGMLLMVPGPTSGYSVVQMTVMWIVLNGIGAANSVWNVVLDQLMQGVPTVGGISMQLKPGDLNNITQSILQSSTCMYAINDEIPGLLTDAGPLQNKSISIHTTIGAPQPAPSAKPATQLTQTATLYVGVEGALEPLRSLCGSFAVTTTILQGDVNTFNYATLQQKLRIKVEALQSMFSAVDAAARILANPDQNTYAPPDPGYVRAAGEAYINKIAAFATGVSAAPANDAPDWEERLKPASALNTDYAALKSYGWIHAGSYYFTMVRATTANIDEETKPGTAKLPASSGVPQRIDPRNLSANNTLTGPWPTTDTTSASSLQLYISTGPTLTKMNNALIHSFDYWNSDRSNPGPPSHGLAMSAASTGDKVLDGIVNGIKDGIQTPILEYVQSIAEGKTATGGVADPLIGIGQFGGILMLAGEIAVFISIISSFLISLIASPASCVSPVAWAINLLFVSILPMIYSLAIVLWTLGATLGIYIPLVPYLVFTMTAFGWIIQVIEAVVAAPIIALALVQPGGEELGKLGSALPILANIFLRPTLMIFGFVLGSSLLRAGIALINFGFIPAINEGAAVSIFSILAVLGFYVGIITSIVNKSFSLIYVLPNQIMRWMGGSAEGGDPGDMVKEAKGGLDSGAGQASKGLEAGHAKASEKTGAKLAKSSKDSKEGQKESAHNTKNKDRKDEEKAQKALQNPQTRGRR
ncbi:MAG TPA: DotA/TraY family protein [Gammaproteobacteria bacterium]|nr:DotA/TraY family protein [Gammaproteobacteria bacterium]